MLERLKRSLARLGAADRPGVVVAGDHAVSVLRACQNRVLRRVAAEVKPRAVVNLGAVPEAPDKEGGRYEAYFGDAAYATLDQERADAPGHITADLEDLSAVGARFDLAVAMSVLEHVRRPWIAAREITRIVSPGGHLFVSMPFFYPLHRGETFGDFWRWTPEANAILFEDFDAVWTERYPSVILKVDDRRTYWTDPDSTMCGFAMLMRRRGGEAPQFPSPSVSLSPP